VSDAQRTENERLLRELEEADFDAVEAEEAESKVDYLIVGGGIFEGRPLGGGGSVRIPIANAGLQSGSALSRVFVERGFERRSYLVDPDEISEPEPGFREFSRDDMSYIIRPVTELDSDLVTRYRGLRVPTEAIKELIVNDNNEREHVEALADMDSGDVLFLTYRVDGMGEFIRADGKWRVPTDEQVDQQDGLEAIPIDYAKAVELVSKWDAGEDMTDVDLAEYRLAETESEES